MFALLLAGAVGLLVYSARPKVQEELLGQPDAGAPVVSDAGVDDDGGAGGSGGGSGEQPTTPGGEIGSDAGTLLLSGETAPALPSDAPKRVRFGVILVQYRGAQGALPTTRSREAALELARTLAAEAKQDFKATVAKGDKGSTEDLGLMPRGILEPAPEYELFSLPKGGVSGPVDTPRGYWIIRRID
ncbi:peptidylprolyl isomerase [Chondromyces crocatus]|uniref:peptidylprolyl isomerase n=1 Tax=Chondromyces crocatus TaxID=52 RepID=UPI0014700095|nr:peptidyl-prolyl cis-trans isomerase [Chondromyces crocatus]